MKNLQSQNEDSLTRILKNIKRFVVLVVGLTVLLIGVALLVLPGPAFIVIPIGLGILATEFLWARRILKRVKNLIDSKKKPEVDRDLSQRQ